MHICVLLPLIPQDVRGLFLLSFLNDQGLCSLCTSDGIRDQGSCPIALFCDMLLKVCFFFSFLKKKSIVIKITPLLCHLLMVRL